MFTLRPYQQEAVEKLIWSQKLEGADLCILPTGAGKSLVLAELAHRIDGHILITQPTKEILEQNVSKMKMYVPESDIGIYSASMHRKDVGPYTFATIQSIYNRPGEFKHFNYVIIDECHLVNPKEKGSMYMQFLNEIGGPKVVGLTATPYRLDTAYTSLGDGNFLASTGTKLINRVKGNFWKRIMFCMNISDLIKSGYLMPLRYIDKTILDHDQIKANKSRSDFDLESYQEQLKGYQDQILHAIFLAEEISRHVLVFCSDIEQAEDLQSLVEHSAVITSKTNKKTREKLIQEFREGHIKTMFNVGVLTTGFDFPELDGIVLLRPTKSIALYYQMLGRGVRIAPNKKHCNVIDLTGTVKFLGRVETIRMVKEKMWELKSETGSWHNKPLYTMNYTSNRDRLWDLSS